jgi:hypothetical protein
MNKKNNIKSRKMKKMITICSLSSLIFVVATYAWFIGMRSVNVSGFEIDIASTDSLLLSLDGEKWDTTVTINEDNFKEVSYAGNVNNWANYGTSNPGLKPISSVGEIDTKTSTMKMFEKGSLTATQGGYRLMASRIHNYDKPLNGFNGEQPQGQYTENGGYVAFDLFIRNFSGREYYSNLDILNEESIYLTTDSKVKVGSTGVADTGIENSVRIAFAQIGRVNGKTTDVDTITNISCATDSVTTGICRTAQIWEPNNIDHVTAALNYYNTSCRKRDNTKELASSNIALANSGAYLKDECATIANGDSMPTYSIRKEISYTDRVDVYDGEAYNGYTKTTKTTAEGDEPLYPYDYFTDTEKNLKGTSRPEFISLAPNSITKVRVYIWIEGQDVDNFDFSSVGKQIQIAFGFTKERFDEEEIQGEDGPNMNNDDKIKPVINGVQKEVTISKADVASYNPRAGVTATDIGGEKDSEVCTSRGGSWSTEDSKCTYDLTTKIQVTNPVKATPGKYVVRYLVSDWQGNYTEASTKVTVE